MNSLLPANTALIWPTDSPRGVLVDRQFRAKLLTVRWRWLPRRQRFRGYFGHSRIRNYLHRYVLQLANRYYPEVSFADDDVFDCRLVNLKAYRRTEEGARRRLFRNSTSRRKGVTWHVRRKKWAAMIRVYGKLRHLGYYAKADDAAAAYAVAWNSAHPDQPQVPVKNRHGNTSVSV